MSSTQKSVEEQPVKMADLFSKCSQLAAQEEKEMSRIVDSMLPVLAYVEEPIMLSPGSLGGSFSELRSVSLQAGATVVTTDLQGNVASNPLLELKAGDCLAILKDAFPKIQRMVADKERAATVRPILSMKIFLGGQRFIVDRRSYRLLVSNSGGDCRDLSIWAELADGRNKPFPERNLSRGGRVEVELGLRNEVDGAEGLRIQFECKDVDGREFCGVESLRLAGDRLQEAPLTRKSSLVLNRAK